MYTGHVAIALAVRGVRDDLPLWSLIAISQACDWVEFFAYPRTPNLPHELYSHAFPFVVIGAGAATLAVWLWKRSTTAAAIAMGLYLSHPVMDYVTGFKPLWLGGPPVGLDFIHRPMADFVVQSLLCAVGVIVYRRSLPPPRRRQIAAVAPLALLLALQAAADVRLEWLKRRRAPNVAAVEDYRATPRARFVASSTYEQSTPRWARPRAACIPARGPACTRALAPRSRSVALF